MLLAISADRVTTYVVARKARVFRHKCIPANNLREEEKAEEKGERCIDTQVDGRYNSDMKRTYWPTTMTNIQFPSLIFKVADGVGENIATLGQLREKVLYLDQFGNRFFANWDESGKLVVKRA